MMNRVSAVICTRNRAESLEGAVRSLLAGSGSELELIVIDQSDNDDTKRILERWGSDPRLCYRRSQMRGKGAALNEGMRIAHSEIVVCTDDDCEAPGGWVTDMATALESQPSAAVLFCNVVAGPHDRRRGYVPGYERRADQLLRSVSGARHGLGLGAGMAIRRQVIMDLGGFDEEFGPGARFCSGDDWDLSLRALLAGWHVYSSSTISIVHHGFRTFADGRKHALRDWIAIGAVFAKPIRAGRIAALGPGVWLFVGQALWPPFRQILLLRRPSGWSRIAGFAQGFMGGFRTPIESSTLRYRPTL